MIAAALGLLRSPLAGWVVGALAAVLVYGAQEYRLRGAMQEAADLRAAVAELEAQNIELQAAIQKQNHMIASLEQAARTREATAGERALRVLNQGERRRREMPQGHGPEVMNQWMSELLQ